MRKLIWKECLLAIVFLFFLFVSLGLLVGDLGVFSTDSSNIKFFYKQDVLKIYTGNLTEKFSPLNYTNDRQIRVLNLCYKNIYYDKSLAQIDNNNNTYTIRFKNNNQITSDDFIYNIYLRVDPSYEGTGKIEENSIVGQSEYMYGTRDIESRKKEIEALVKKPDKDLKNKIQSEVIKPALISEFQWVKSLYGNKKYDYLTGKYKEPKDLFAYYYAYKTSYSSKNKSEQTVLQQIIKDYGYNYCKLEKVTNKSLDYKVNKIALLELLKDKGKDTVNFISGIKKIDDKSVELKINNPDKTFAKIQNMFLIKYSSGFKKGMGKIYCDKDMSELLTTGAYKLVSADDKKYYFERKEMKKNANEIKRLEISKSEYYKEKELVKDLLNKKIDIGIISWSNNLDKMIENNGTGAAFKIRKIGVTDQNEEECILYGTNQVNATVLPWKVKDIVSLFVDIERAEDK